MAWNTRTNLRAVEKTTQLVVAICQQMEDWRRILRHLDRLEEGRCCVFHCANQPHQLAWRSRAVGKTEFSREGLHDQPIEP